MSPYSQMCRLPSPPYKRLIFAFLTQSVFGSQVVHTLQRSLVMTLSPNYTHVLSPTRTYIEIIWLYVLNSHVKTRMSDLLPVIELPHLLSLKA